MDAFKDGDIVRIPLLGYYAEFHYYTSETEAVVGCLTGPCTGSTLEVHVSQIEKANT